MSASPPPPPPFRTSPGPYANSFDRRTLRAQRRAAAAQARQQTQLWQAQMRAARRTSAAGPVLLICLGIVFLLLQTGRLHWSPLLLWFSRWWPLVLVAAGVILLMEWAWDGREGAGLVQGMQPRRTLGRGTATLLVVLALTGALAMAAENGSAWIRRNFEGNFNSGDLPGWDWLGDQSVNVADLSAPLSNGGLLTLSNPKGKITVTGSSTDGQVHVSVRRHTFRWYTDDAADPAGETPKLETVGGGLAFSVGGNSPGQADLTVQTPHEIALTLRGTHGEVSLGELHGPIEIQDHTGNVQLTALTGPVHLIMRDDDADVTGHSLSGGLTIEGRSGDVTLSDINGPLNLHGDFFGTTQLERVHGDVRFVSSFTNFACAGVAGELTVEGRNELEGRELDGPVTLSTTDRNITLAGVRGGAAITDRNGSVQLTLSDPLGPVHVSTTDGSVRLNVPEKAGFTLSAQTNDGKMTNDFGLVPEEHEDHAALNGRVKGGGATVVLQTTEGDVAVAKASSADWSGDDDSGVRTKIGTSPAQGNEDHTHAGRRKH